MTDNTGVNKDVVVPEPTRTEEPRYNLQPNRAQAGRWNKRLYGLHLTIKLAGCKLGDRATKAIIKEMNQMLEKRVFHPVYLKDMSRDQTKNIICCFMFLNEKYRPDGNFEKVKARPSAEQDSVCGQDIVPYSGDIFSVHS